jgi:hypothetical protein
MCKKELGRYENIRRQQYIHGMLCPSLLVLQLDSLLALPTKAKDIVFRFIIEYSSLMDFGPYPIGLFLYENF